MSLSLRTGLDPNLTYTPIHIPKSAENAFSSSAPIGPFTLWQNLNGTKFTPRGTIDLDTGQFIKTGVNRAHLQWQATDIVVGGGVGIGAYTYFNEDD
jgi:hypothetical protein